MPADLLPLITTVLDRHRSACLDSTADRAAVEADLVATLEAAPATVEDAIDARVIEYRDAKGRWRQCELSGIEHRIWNRRGGWGPWDLGGLPEEHAGLPVRYVGRIEADDAPSTRGPIEVPRG